MILTLVMVYLVTAIVTLLVSYLVSFSYQNYKETNGEEEEVVDLYELRKNEQDELKREEELRIQASQKRPIETRSK